MSEILEEKHEPNRFASFIHLHFLLHLDTALKKCRINIGYALERVVAAVSRYKDQYKCQYNPIEFNNMPKTLNVKGIQTPRTILVSQEPCGLAIMFQLLE